MRKVLKSGSKYAANVIESKAWWESCTDFYGHQSHIFGNWGTLESPLVPADFLVIMNGIFIEFHS